MTEWIRISDMADHEALRHANKQAAADIAALEADNARLLAENQELRRENMALRDKIRKLEDDLAEEVRQARLSAFQERHAASQARQEAERLRGELSAVDEALGEFYCPVRDPDTGEPCGSFYKDHGVSIAIEELRKAREEIAVDDVLLAEYNRVLEAVPPCPVHGAQCVPHALEWIQTTTGRLRMLERVVARAFEERNKARPGSAVREAMQFVLAPVVSIPIGSLYECDGEVCRAAR